MAVWKSRASWATWRSSQAIVVRVAALVEPRRSFR
jgi:hypothetical protein